MGLPRFRPPAPRRRPAVGMTPLRKAQVRASRLTETEIREIMDAVNHCAARLREGVATEVQAHVLRTTLQIALEICRAGHVRGMDGHIEAALVSLSSIMSRAQESGVWHPTPLHWYELDAISSAIDLHDHQLRQLSAEELRRVTQRVIAQSRSQGGGVLQHVSPADIGMEVST